MAIETEIKLRIDDPDEIRRRLLKLGFEEIQPRTLEDNWLFDSLNGALAERGRMLRLRTCGERSTLTFKGPAEGDSRFKNREEVEVGVEDPEALRGILGRIGLAVSYRYQKYRAELLREGLHACVDEVPFGAFVELEGPEEAILAAADELGFGPDDFLRESYRALHQELTRARGEETLGHLLFEES